MLSFVSAIKQILSDIERTGGVRSEGLHPSPELLQRIKQALQSDFSRPIDQSVFEPQLEDIQLEEHIRVCAVYLHKRGIGQEDQILPVLLRMLPLIHDDHSEEVATDADREMALAHSLLAIWRDMGDRQTYLYTVARNRALIVWDNQSELWRVTALGRVFIDLQPMQTILFFLTIDLLFSTGEYDPIHISKEVFLQLQAPLTRTQQQTYRHHLTLLYRLGLFSFESDTRDRAIRTYALNSMGKLVLDRLLSPDNPFLDTVVGALEANDAGESSDAFEKEIPQILDLVAQSTLVDEDNRRSIHKSVGQYRSGDPLDALRIVYPSIESIVNYMLLRARRTADGFNGLARKAEWLSQRGIIPDEIAQAARRVELRNYVVHGSPVVANKYAAPFYQYALQHVQQLLFEYRPC